MLVRRAVGAVVSVAWLTFSNPGHAAEPVFSPSGPDAAAYGAPEYRVGTFANANRQAEMVGNYSHYDALRASRVVRRPVTVAPLRRDGPEAAISYSYRGASHTMLDYLDRHPATAMVLVKNGVILFEHYQYGRTDRDRMVSQSMAKTVTALLVGIAVSEGRIRSIDDTAETYAPRLHGTLHGGTPIRALLTMSSGVAFRETYGDPTADNSRFGRALFARDSAGPEAAFAMLTERAAAPGTRFNYAGADTEALGVVLRAVTGVPQAEYLQSRLWQPMGAEADAAWVLDGAGQEPGFCCMTAVARDWVRLGLLMANDGAANGRQIVPAAWIREMTTPAAPYLAPGQATKFDGYGFQTWLLAGPRRMFAFRGIHGQAVLVDPASKLVLVHTAVRVAATGDPNAGELAALWRAAVEQLGR